MIESSLNCGTFVVEPWFLPKLKPIEDGGHEFLVFNAVGKGWLTEYRLKRRAWVSGWGRASFVTIFANEEGYEWVREQIALLNMVMRFVLAMKADFRRPALRPKQ